MSKLIDILDKYETDKGTIHGHEHGFSKFYEKYFEKIKNCQNILEIGVGEGASLYSWQEYFKEAFIFGADCVDKSEYNTDKIKCFILDQSDKSSLQKFVDNNNITFDLIIDDGSHHMKDQQLTLGYLFPILKPGGLYILEDLHTSLATNGHMMYGKPLEIYEDHSNTTLYYLNNMDKGSIYLTETQNNYILKNILNIEFFTNEHYYPGGHFFQNKSITSAILKTK